MVYYDKSLCEWYCGICAKSFLFEDEAVECEQNDDKVPGEQWE